MDKILVKLLINLFSSVSVKAKYSFNLLHRKVQHARYFVSKGFFFLSSPGEGEWLAHVWILLKDDRKALHSYPKAEVLL